MAVIQLRIYSTLALLIIIYIISVYANARNSIGVVIRDCTAGNADSLWYRVPMKFDIWYS